MKKILLIIAGFLSLLLGGIGLMLPVLPTTPFVLIAAGCFGASSPRLYRRLQNNRYFGEYVRNYKEKSGISTQARRNGLLFLWGTLAVSALLFRSAHVWAILGIVGIAVSIHILTIRRVVERRSDEAPTRNTAT